MASSGYGLSGSHTPTSEGVCSDTVGLAYPELHLPLHAYMLAKCVMHRAFWKKWSSGVIEGLGHMSLRSF